MAAVAELDIGLLEGFAFSCRPGCGLCCFANPAVTKAERSALVQIRPQLDFLPGEDGYSFLPSRPGGGACELLEAARCSAHVARPFPCRSFPISVHLGPRAQASLVLSCPGLELDGLDASADRHRPAAAIGLEAELAAVRAELARPEAREAAAMAATEFDQALRRQRTRPGWIEPEAFRGELREDERWADLGGYPEPPPSLDAGADTTPLTFVPALGVVGLGGEEGRWTVRAAPEGGGGVDLGTYDLPDEPPHLQPAAVRALRGYLTYAFARDAPFGQLLASLRRSRSSWEDALWAAVDEAASVVVTRAAVLSAARGETPTDLGREALLAGVRAADADLLDRPTVGSVL